MYVYVDADGWCVCLVQFDGRSMALESGRYMETVGTSSSSLFLTHTYSDSFTYLVSFFVHRVDEREL